MSLCKKFWVKAQHRVVELLREKLELKLKRTQDLKPGESAKSKAEMEMQILSNVGIKKMMQWIEDDADAIQEKKQDEEKEKQEGGTVAHSVT